MIIWIRSDLLCERYLPGNMVGTCSTRRRDHRSMIFWIRSDLLCERYLPGTMVGTCSMRRRDHRSMIIWIRSDLLCVRVTVPTGDYGGDMLYEEEGPPLYDHLDQVRPTL